MGISFPGASFSRRELVQWFSSDRYRYVCMHMCVQVSLRTCGRMCMYACDMCVDMNAHLCLLYMLCVNVFTCMSGIEHQPPPS